VPLPGQGDLGRTRDHHQSVAAGLASTGLAASVLIDATVVRRNNGMTIDLWYAGKTHDFGGNIQALVYPSGIPLWVSEVLPGNVHDLAAARENVLAVLRPFLETVPVLADPGYEGAGHGLHVPVKKPAGVKSSTLISGPATRRP
jgi:DDE superfamily endonuclease